MERFLALPLVSKRRNSSSRHSEGWTIVLEHGLRDSCVEEHGTLLAVANLNVLVVLLNRVLTAVPATSGMPLYTHHSRSFFMEADCCIHSRCSARLPTTSSFDSSAEQNKRKSTRSAATVPPIPRNLLNWSSGERRTTASGHN